MDKPTNEYIIRHKWSTQQLAEALIKVSQEEDWDEGFDGESYVIRVCDVYTTSDNERFYEFENAVEHEIRWLKHEIGRPILDEMEEKWDE